MKQISYGSHKMTAEEVATYVGPGWHSIVTRLIDDLFELGWDGKLLQIKEKFGGLRFYVDSGNEAIFRRINEAEGESVVTSEFSGKPGRVRDTGWMKTLDDEEYDKYKETGNLNFLHKRNSEHSSV